jgi:hypothetical protein
MKVRLKQSTLEISQVVRKDPTLLEPKYAQQPRHFWPRDVITPIDAVDLAPSHYFFDKPSSNASPAQEWKYSDKPD